MRNYIIIVFLISGLCSCGSRKVEKQIAIENSSLDVKQTEMIDLKAETIKKAEFNTSEFEWTAEPVNPDKEMEFTAPDGKTYKGKNTKLTGKKKQEKSEVTEKSKVKALGKTTTDIKLDAKTKNKAVKIDRDAVFPVSTVVCIVVVLSFLIWLILWLRKKTKNIKNNPLNTCT